MKRRDMLIDEVAHMIGNQTYNHAPINYTIAEKAIEMVERFHGIKHEGTR